jgi:hypothetical protein
MTETRQVLMLMRSMELAYRFLVQRNRARQQLEFMGKSDNYVF